MRHPAIVRLLILAISFAATALGCAHQEIHGETSAVETAIPMAADNPAAAGEIRQAVERSLPYLETEGVAWMEQRQCVSCHQIPMLIWSFQAAADHGLPVDGTKLEVWTEWTLERSRGEESDNHDGINHLILGRPHRDAGLEAEFVALSPFILDQQQEAGTWKAGGQLPLQRRSAEESHRVSTAWSILALTAAQDGSDAVERARAGLRQAFGEPGESLEWLLVRLLLAGRRENGETPDPRTAGWHEELLTAQNDDGGWSWLRGEASDAFATGQTLYTLALLPDLGPDDRNAIERGRRYLLETQAQDGSWPTRSTLKREHGPTPTGTYWATGWAVVGLLRTLPQGSQMVASHGN